MILANKMKEKGIKRINKISLALACVISSVLSLIGVTLVIEGQKKVQAEKRRMVNSSGSIYNLENNDKTEDIQKDTADKIINLDISGSEKLKLGKPLHKCEEWEASYKCKTGLKYPTRKRYLLFM